MKRCKACTTRAAGAVECTLPADHEGSHEGEKFENGTRSRAVWNDPNAPYFELLEPSALAPEKTLPPAPPLPELEELPPELELEPAPTRRDIALVRSRTIATHCACGTEHTGDDRELRMHSGSVPLVAMPLGENEPDPRFSWARVCIGCGAVYCRIWDGRPVQPARSSCTCPLIERGRLDFTHAAGCPATEDP